LPLRQVLDRVRLASLLQVLSLFALCLGFMEARTHPCADSSQPVCCTCAWPVEQQPVSWKEKGHDW